MKRRVRILIAVMIIVATAAISATPNVGIAQESAAPAASVQIFDSPKDVKWGPAPPMLPKGAQLAVLDGDPMKEGSPFTVRLKMPDGYKVPAHSHPTDENVTVLSGTLGAGMGDKLDKSKGQLIKTGGSCGCLKACITSRGRKDRRPSRFMASDRSRSRTLILRTIHAINIRRMRAPPYEG